MSKTGLYHAPGPLLNLLQKFSRLILTHIIQVRYKHYPYFICEAERI